MLNLKLKLRNANFLNSHLISYSHRKSIHDSLTLVCRTSKQESGSYLF